MNVVCDEPQHGGWKAVPGAVYERHLGTTANDKGYDLD